VILKTLDFWLISEFSVGTTESVGKPRNDRSLELKHAGNTTAVIIKTLDFSLLLEFLVATRDPEALR
jgi:hypothetical protein